MSPIAYRSIDNLVSISSSMFFPMSFASRVIFLNPKQ